MLSEFERFTNKITKTDTCWTWTGAIYRGGYGHFRRKVDGKWKMYKTHRYSYEYYHGPIPEGKIILHSCDNPACVNPNHLSVGTHKENTGQCIARGRKVFGINPNHRSHSQLCYAIREYHISNPSLTGRAVAKQFNTSPAQVSRILNNKIWVSPEEL
jgi:hypothetical protein